MRDWLALAEWIARASHEGQKDTVTGADYIHHVERVVGRVTDRRAQAVAWLHDVLEDSPVVAGELLEAGIPADIVRAVELLTRTGDYTYEQYIAQILVSGDELAVQVKLADLDDHLTPQCPARLRPRYEAAVRALRP